MRTPTSKIVDDLLVFLAMGGVAGLTIAAPNSLAALEKPLNRLLFSRRQKQESRRIASYLKQQELVTVKINQDGSYQIRLSEKGAVRSTRARFEQLEIPRGKWDRKWRIIMFDIPEKHKTARDYISRHLREIGFKSLQRSVFVYPHPVDEFVILLQEIFPEVSKHIIYLTTDKIDAHNQLVHRFRAILK